RESRATVPDRAPLRSVPPDELAPGALAARAIPAGRRVRFSRGYSTRHVANNRSTSRAAMAGAGGAALDRSAGLCPSFHDDLGPVLARVRVGYFFVDPRHHLPSPRELENERCFRLRS